MQPGDVVITRPEPPVVRLSQLEEELAQATHLLHSLATQQREWDFDLGINARWAAVDQALDKLKSTVVPGKAAPVARRK
jgi:hypothetical protein